MKAAGKKAPGNNGRTSSLSQSLSQVLDEIVRVSETDGQPKKIGVFVSGPSIEARSSIKLFGPPRLVALVKIFRLAAKANALSRSPRT